MSRAGIGADRAAVGPNARNGSFRIARKSSTGRAEHGAWFNVMSTTRSADRAPWRTAPGGRKAKLLQRVRLAIRGRQYSPRTEQTYVGWIRRYLVFHGRRHPAALGQTEVEQFLEHLASHGRVSASTQDQAASALLFLYRDVLDRPLQRTAITRARSPRRLPVVLTPSEVALVLGELRGAKRLVVELLYGSGLRLNECMSIRVKDLDFTRHQITVRRAKGNRDRITMLAESIAPKLARHLERVKRLHERDLRDGSGHVRLPGALVKKYPNAAREWPWQYVFPAARRSQSCADGRTGRHHLHLTAVQRAVRKAAQASGLSKRVTCHTFRHSFATELLRAGYDIRTIQELLGHRSVKTTMIYTHVLNRGGRGVRSPADSL